MTNISPVVAESPSNGAASLLPLQQRLRWEQQWLNENKSAFNVIKNAVSNTSYQSVDLQFRQNEKALSEPATMDADSNAPAFAFSDAAIGKNLIAGGDVVPTQKTIVVNTAQGQLSPEPPLLPASEQETITMSGAFSADVDKLYRRQELRQSAVWRDGKNVAVSMRLPKQLRDDQAIFITLRQWLADAGLKLQTLIVNGRSQ